MGGRHGAHKRTSTGEGVGVLGCFGAEGWLSDDELFSVIKTPTVVVN